MSPDFKDLLSEFNARGVEYLVAGAVATQGRVRPTADVERLEQSGRHETASK